MKIYTPLSVALRVIIYSLLMFGLAEAVRFDALFPMEEGYFGEISMVEISQEIILFAMFVFYLIFGFKFREIQPVSNILSLFFLISFIREFNFLIDFWVYPALLVLAMIVWLVFRDFRKLKSATQTFFSYPASAWFFSGFLVTYIFSRLFGRSKFWLLIYDESNYRLAKAATEEGIELLGDALMLIGAIEFIFVWLAIKNEERK